MSKEKAIKTGKVKTGDLKKLQKNAADKTPVKKEKGSKKEKKVKKDPAERKVMYKYPADVNTPETKKNFRAMCRKKMKSFEKDLIRIKKGKSKKKEEDVRKEQAAFKKAHMNEAA